MKSIVAVTFLACLAVLCGQVAHEPLVPTDKLSIVWDANSEPDLAGYRIYMTGPNTNAIRYTSTTTNTQMSVLAELCKTNRLQPGVYTLWATAFNTAGLESEPSSNVVRNIGYPPGAVFTAVFTNTFTAP